jgi:crotonobetainyl-CoA:carnitine CoA-transferase CaiB-like acyl-CoA transferase
MLRHVEHPSGVLVPQVATPMRFSDAQLPECKAPPLLGQHSNAILQELGYDDFKIKELKDKGVI